RPRDDMVHTTRPDCLAVRNQNNPRTQASLRAAAAAHGTCRAIWSSIDTTPGVPRPMARPLLRPAPIASAYHESTTAMGTSACKVCRLLKSVDECMVYS